MTGNLPADGHNRVVLVVDDEQDIRDALATLLFFLGYSTLLSPDRDDALKLLKKNSADVVIMDWHMPGMSIEEFLEHFRNMEAQPPIVLLTAANKASDKARELGLQHYMPKPFDLEMLNRKLRECLTPA